MTIQLPKDLETSIRDAVVSGHFASVDEAMTEAARLLLSKLNQPKAGTVDTAGNEPAAPAHKPIWEEFEEITSSIPAEEWAKLPADGAEQHDHYIYGSPKRRPSQ
jgi:Arc/MetJ-type ribon-helix-helix transcriptional regulator